MTIIRRRNLIAAALIGAVVFTGSVTQVAAQSVSEKVATTAGETKEKVQDAGKAAATKLERLWQQIDEARLKNRTRDEIVAWLIMGVVVGSILGRATKLSWSTAFVFGLIGAFLGGLVVHLTQFDMGLGPVLVRYEDLLAALIGAVLVLFVARRVMKTKEKKT
jgi:uncharacterized membrane protein YeaQ/YmgE (transglycosylase-associated protein family)